MGSKFLPHIAGVPTWAKEPQIAPLRALKAPLYNSAPAISTSPKPALLHVDDAAATLQVSSKTVRRLVARGDLKAVRIGRSVRIPSSEIDRLIADGGARGGDFGEEGGGV